jgi:hypothetical protein
VPSCWLEETITPSRVQASTSMWGVDAPLADQAQTRQTREQRGADLRAFANEDQRFGVLQALGQHVDILDNGR